MHILIDKRKFLVIGMVMIASAISAQTFGVYDGKSDIEKRNEYGTLNNVMPYSGNHYRYFPWFALKTNLLYDVGLITPNIAVEFGMGKKFTTEISFAYNPWEIDKKKHKQIKHWVIKPEFRYWFCERFSGHFMGIHPFYGEYNVSGYKIPSLFKKEFRYEGNAIGAGISYGYHWILGSHWSIEASIGVGNAYLDYDRFECGECGQKLETKSKNYFGPTKAAVSLIYIIK